MYINVDLLQQPSNNNTSVKIIQLNEYGCRDAPCEKSWKQGNPLSNTIKDISTIMPNPLSELCREGYACHDFSHGASLHPYSFIFTLVPHIFCGFAYKRSYNIRSYAYKRSYNIRAYARMRTCVALRLYHVLV